MNQSADSTVESHIEKHTFADFIRGLVPVELLDKTRLANFQAVLQQYGDFVVVQTNFEIDAHADGKITVGLARDGYTCSIVIWNSAFSLLRQ